MNTENSQILLSILAFKTLMEYEKSMVSKYFEYKKRAALSDVRDLIIKMERDSYGRLKKLNDAVKKLNLEKMNQPINTLDDIEVLKELRMYLAAGYGIYNDYIITINNPYARDIFKELREGILEYITSAEAYITRYKNLPQIQQEIYPIK